MYRDQRLSGLLAYLGAMPFWALALGRFVGLDPTWTMSAFLAYGTGIACFMAGTIWSQAQVRTGSPLGLLLFSNGVALTAIAALLLHPAFSTTALVLQAATFPLLLLADYRIFRGGDQPGWYFGLRRNVTVIVVVAYGIAIATG
ncbi:MAG: DUF3429 domain-containing protein [Rhizobium sp.]|nr:DUF3429 domain-containing protein [Rhizobium sp.]